MRVKRSSYKCSKKSSVKEKAWSINKSACTVPTVGRRVWQVPLLRCYIALSQCIYGQQPDHKINGSQSLRNKTGYKDHKFDALCDGQSMRYIKPQSETWIN